MEKIRLQWIDLAKGLCMLLVVLGHFPDSTLTEQGQITAHIMSSFRMPLYFMLSGLFFKTYGDFCHFTLKKIDHLLIPYVIFYLLERISPFLDFSAIWFLFSLFAMNILGYGIIVSIHHILDYIHVKDERKIKTFCGALIISLILGGLAYNQHWENDIHIKVIPQHTVYVEAALVSLPFFLVGYGLRNFTSFLSQHQGMSALRMLEFLICCLLVVGFCYVYNWGDNSFFINDYPLPFVVTYITGVFGSIGILLLACQMVHIPVISYIGRYSIIVLITHFIVIHFWEWTFYVLLSVHQSFIVSVCLYVIIVLSELPIIWFCVRYLPYAFAQKELLGGFVMNSALYLWYVRRVRLNKNYSNE